MEQYSDQEQVEAIRKWWRENGKAIVGGLLLGLGGVLGWQFWQSHERSTAEQASALYLDMQRALSTDDSNEAGLKAAVLREEYPASPYAALAGLALAAEDVETDSLPDAAEHLRWVVDHGRQPELVDVARMRLARILMTQENYAQALAQLESVDAPYRAEADEIRGDVYLRQGEKDRAREAYQAARAAAALGGTASPWLEMKINDLTAAGPGEQASESAQ